MSEREEYTPSMNDLRTDYMSEYCFHGRWEDDTEKGRAFDRAIAAHDRALREQIAREILDEASSYAGDMSGKFAKIYARIARGEEK